MRTIRFGVIAVLVLAFLQGGGDRDLRAQSATPTAQPLSAWDRNNRDQLVAELKARQHMTPEQMKTVQPIAQFHERFKTCIHAGNPHAPTPLPLPSYLLPENSPYQGHTLHLTPLPPPASSSQSPSTSNASAILFVTIS
jgi:hypothetical protein